MLDLDITYQLKQEGIVRDVIRLVQQARKEADLHISDRIALHLKSSNDEVNKAITHHAEVIKAQCLVERLNEQDEYAFTTCQHCEGSPLDIKIVGVGS